MPRFVLISLFAFNSYNSCYLVVEATLSLQIWGNVAARVREILENVGLAQEGLPSNVVASAQCLANVASLLNTRDTELSRWVDFFFF